MRILYRARPSKTSRRVYLYCRITVNRIRAKSDFSVNIVLPKNKWDAGNQRAIGPAFEWINLELLEISDGIRGIASMLRGKGPELDADTIKAAWLESQKPAPQTKLYDLFLDYEAGQKRTEASGKAQARRARVLGGFIKEAGDRAGMQAAFGQRFKNLCPAVRQKHLYYLNGFLAWAENKGRENCRPLAFKIRLEKKPVFVLSKEQMDAVISGAEEGPEKDFMLLQLCTGLAFADAAGLCAANMKDAGGDLGFYLEVERKKSGGLQVIPLMGRAAGLLAKWGGAAPPVRYHIYSALLAGWGEAAGLPFRFTSHVCRKTCATMLYCANVPLSHVSRILGHSKTAITEKLYARLDVESIIKSVRAAGF